jgi:hypothetical protein
MKKLRNLLLGLACVMFILMSCDDDESSVRTSSMSIQMSGLTTPGAGYVYGVWLKEGEAYDFLGDFSLTSNGLLTKSLYSIESQRLAEASGLLITLEKEGGIGASPSDIRFLAGSFENKGAKLTMDHPDAIGLNYSLASAAYIRATPTDNDTTNEESGLWFYNTMNMVSTLDLPVLSSSWMYESWVQTTNDSLISLGKFSDPLAADMNDLYGAGINPGYAAPGQDFLANRSDLPIDLDEAELYITVEPSPDDATTPFGLRPLSIEVADTIPALPVPLEFNEIGIARGIAIRG